MKHHIQSNYPGFDHLPKLPLSLGNSRLKSKMKFGIQIKNHLKQDLM
jgi:hypothetical protein